MGYFQYKAVQVPYPKDHQNLDAEIRKVKNEGVYLIAIILWLIMHILFFHVFSSPLAFMSDKYLYLALLCL